VKQFHLGQTADRADWLIGQGVFAPGVHGVALRSMKAPGTAYDDPNLGTDPQPADMVHYVDTADDDGGVHINSGIPNHAFYLAATAIGGHAWEKAGRIWYTTLTGGDVPKGADFATFAGITDETAGRLFGVRSAERDAVRDAWAKVGVTIT
jgi:Zn-dependent metalloprotease